MPSNSEVTAPSFGEIPSIRKDAVGGRIGSTAIICGGYDGTIR